jgi:hypothetical protein
MRLGTSGDDALIEMTPEDLASVEAIFEMSSNGGLGHADVNAFWDKLIEENGVYTLNKNAITYDEARRLGLTPDENES